MTKHLLKIFLVIPVVILFLLIIFHTQVVACETNNHFNHKERDTVKSKRDEIKDNDKDDKLISPTPTVPQSTEISGISPTPDKNVPSILIKVSTNIITENHNSESSKLKSSTTYDSVPITTPQTTSPLTTILSGKFPSITPTVSLKSANFNYTNRIREIINNTNETSFSVKTNTPLNTSIVKESEAALPQSIQPVVTNFQQIINTVAQYKNAVYSSDTSYNTKYLNKTIIRASYQIENIRYTLTAKQTNRYSSVFNQKTYIEKSLKFLYFNVKSSILTIADSFTQIRLFARPFS